MKLLLVSFSTVLIAAAFGAGWLLGNRESTHRQLLAATECEKRIAEALNVAKVLNDATNTNLWIGNQFSDQQQKTMLLAEILSLSQAEPYKNDSHDGMVAGDNVFLMHARNALELLEFESAESFEHLLGQEGHFDKLYRSAIQLPDGTTIGTPLDFAHRAFTSRGWMPSFPATQWLKAVTTEDIELLKTCFADSVSLPTGESWDNLLKNYRDELTREVSSFDSFAFSFPWSADDMSGEVYLKFENDQLRTFPIVNVGGEWKLGSL
ncbi:hypothetical protein SH528x_003606 [Novipirellula sp. SH528]|uniref:hypothetical protein n=1 Tax=Novipirellula sp. SH528 TaxID=3454466 RepID=UPI003F9F3AB4